MFLNFMDANDAIMVISKHIIIIIIIISIFLSLLDSGHRISLPRRIIIACGHIYYSKN